MTKELYRCEWANGSELYQQYHDDEWGLPNFDEHKLFEFLILESAQAGLSWITILNKRSQYEKAFFNFNPEKMANMSNHDIEDLLINSHIVRNRKKIESAINNAQCYLKLKEQGIYFTDFMWQFVKKKPVINAWKKIQDAPTQTKESELMSKTLKQHGFNFVGPTICYAYMQAVGMVNDHVVDCFRYQACCT